MESQHQVDHRQRLVNVAPQVVREALPEGDDQHRRKQPGGPFTQFLRRVAEDIEEGLHPRALGRLGDDLRKKRPGQFHQVVQQAQGDGQDARPLVRQVHAVQPVERTLQPGRSHRQQHDQGHQGECRHASEQDGLLAQHPDIQGRRRVKEQRQAEGGRDCQKYDPDDFHDSPSRRANPARPWGN
ncbi:hypothetical protein D9M72_523110 [compost metagenome]